MISKLERVVLWMLVVVAVYQLGVMQTQDQISTIARDATRDVLQYNDYPTKMFLIREYVNKEEWSDLNERIIEIEANVEELEERGER